MEWAGIAQSVLRLAACWMVWVSNPGGGEIFCTLLDRPFCPPQSRIQWVGSFLWVKWPGRGVNHPPHHAPMLKKE